MSSGWLRNRIATDPDAIDDRVLGALTTINQDDLDCFDSVVRRTVIAAPETGRRILSEPDAAHPGPPEWPEADYIVGNPPFTGGKDIRADLGDAYAEALWAANPDVGRSADLVMYFWNRAAAILTRHADMCALGAQCADRPIARNRMSTHAPTRCQR